MSLPPQGAAPGGTGQPTSPGLVLGTRRRRAGSTQAVPCAYSASTDLGRLSPGGSPSGRAVPPELDGAEPAGWPVRGWQGGTGFRNLCLGPASCRPGPPEASHSSFDTSVQGVVTHNTAAGNCPRVPSRGAQGSCDSPAPRSDTCMVRCAVAATPRPEEPELVRCLPTPPGREVCQPWRSRRGPAGTGAGPSASRRPPPPFRQTEGSFPGPGASSRDEPVTVSEARATKDSTVLLPLRCRTDVSGRAASPGSSGAQAAAGTAHQRRVTEALDLIYPHRRSGNPSHPEL